MNEKLVFTFMQDGRPLPIDELVSVELDMGGVVLKGESSAWPRGLRFDFEGVGAFKDGLNLLRKQTANGDHRFSLTVEDGALAITTINPSRIPTGSYDYRLRIADLDIPKGAGRIQLNEGDPPVEIQINVGSERRGVELTDTIQNDQPINDLVNGSSLIDGKSIIDWLKDEAPRPERKACLLNILGKLSISPADAPLISLVQEIFLVDVSRIYAKVDPALFNRLRELDQTSRQFTLDHGPLDPVHQKILRRIPQEDQEVTEQYRGAMRSFRQDTQPSIQIVVFPPPDDRPGRGCYADIDIDLGNPTRDMAGFFIHLGELIDEGHTDHIGLNKQLKRDAMLNGHLHYTITKL